MGGGGVGVGGSRRRQRRLRCNVGVWWPLVVADGGGDLGGQDGMENATQKLLDVGVNKRYGYNRQFCLRKYVCTTPVASIKCEGHKN